MRIEDPAGALENAVENVERIALVAAADVKVQRVDRHPRRLRDGHRFVETIRVDPELGWLVAGVAQPLVVARTEAGVQADADHASRGACAEPAYRADRIAIDMHARVRAKDLEVRIRYGVARE